MIFTQQTGFRDTNIYQNKIDKCFIVSLCKSLPLILFYWKKPQLHFLSTNKF